MCDTGLTQVLGQISSGQSLENSVFQSLRPWFKLSYYQRNSQEIDFILEHKIALEVKETPSQRDLQKLLARSNKLNLKERYLVSLTFSQLPEVILAIDL